MNQMEIILIDNGKTPDEPYNAKLGFWLPPDSPYGNFQLKLMKICQKLDEANLRLVDSHKFWKLCKTNAILPCNVYDRHVYANEQAIYFIRRVADEMIALVWCLSEWERTGVYPKQIDIDCIGSVLKESNARQFSIFKSHTPMLTTLNHIANAFKHSFVQTDLNVVGRDEPCVHALRLDYNKLATGVKFYSVSLAGLVKEFNAFYKEGMDWLRMFSERHRDKMTNQFCPPC